jgi:ribosomal-protein-alanine N-acetyltransferase
MNPRLATADDIPAMIALEKATPAAAHWSEQAYRAVFEGGSPMRIAFVVEYAGLEGVNSLLGFLLARISGPECELENIVVDTGYQRHGIGCLLMQTAVAAARAHEAKRILLEVRESNAAARALYEKFDFNIAGRRKRYFSNPVEDAVLYERVL